MTGRSSHPDSRHVQHHWHSVSLFSASSLPSLTFCPKKAWTPRGDYISMQSQEGCMSRLLLEVDILQQSDIVEFEVSFPLNFNKHAPFSTCMRRFVCYSTSFPSRAPQCSWSPSTYCRRTAVRKLYLDKPWPKVVPHPSESSWNPHCEMLGLRWRSNCRRVNRRWCGWVSVWLVSKLIAVR